MTTTLTDDRGLREERNTIDYTNAPERWPRPARLEYGTFGKD